MERGQPIDILCGAAANTGRIKTRFRLSIRALCLLTKMHAVNIRYALERRGVEYETTIIYDAGLGPNI